jgi:hypothetical protein
MLFFRSWCSLLTDPHLKQLGRNLLANTDDDRVLPEMMSNQFMPLAD